MSGGSVGQAPSGEAAAAAPRASPATGRGSRPRLAAAVGLAVLLVAAVAALFAYLIARHDRAAHPRPYGIPSSVSASLAYLMALSPVYPPSHAPDFTLTDQAGRTLALSSFRGKVVVLEFMDSHCTDICPIVSDEFLRAYHDLGPAARSVVFVTVNVNQYHAAIADVAAFTRAQQLTTIPSWHFFTGPVPRLQAVWRAYGVTVEAPNPDTDIVHTSIAYFIDPQGRERYVATPMEEHTKKGVSFLPPDQLAAWGHGIALVARDLAR